MNSAGLTNITPVGAIDLAFNGNATSQQVVTFSGAGLTNPYLLMNFTEAGDTFDFGANTLTLIAANNAQLSGNSVTSNSVGNTAIDGFVVRFLGTYTNLSFNVIRSGAADSVAFSVAVAVPEPSTYIFGTISVMGLALVQKRRSRLAQQS